MVICAYDITILQTKLAIDYPLMNIFISMQKQDLVGDLITAVISKSADLARVLFPDNCST